jgi:ribosomal protein S18 acetylase RimI-like enzyme
MSGPFEPDAHKAEPTHSHAASRALGTGRYRSRKGGQVDETASMISVRQAKVSDGPQLWALNALPNVGATADPDLPLQLPPAGPPTDFPDLADVMMSFVGAGGDFVIAETDGQLVGMGGIKPTSVGQAEVLRVRVHPARRRRGVGRQLMGELEARAAALGLHALQLDTADNQPDAVAFYRSLGYQETGRENQPDWTWTLVYFLKHLS